MAQAPRTFLVTGYAKAPQGTAMFERYKHAGVVLEVEASTHRIVDAEVTFITDLAKRFFKRLIVGFSLVEDVDAIVLALHEWYVAPSRDAVIVAVRTAAQRYQEHIMKR